MAELFGTDGVRGIPGEPPLVGGVVRRIGHVAASLLLERRRRQGWHPNGTAPLVLLARDSRASGPALARAVADGVAKAGCAAADLGLLPTPALAYLTPRRGALCGVMISASHNPAEFNGIKFFTADGFKMAPELEREIESRLEGAADPGRAPRPPRSAGGGEAAREYLDFLRSTFPADRDLSGLRIVVDCANGAAARIGPRLFESLGAEVFAVGCRPDGRNINSGCGALDTAAMRREVARRRAHCGVSLDGDADRAIFADERGRLLDGDVLLSIAALHLQAQGLLKGNAVVVTVMSNLGLVSFLRERGIGVVTVPVGDKNVTDAIERGGLSLGGENSGHIVFRRFAPTGDGLLTAVQTLAASSAARGPMSRLGSRYKTYPQVLKNVRVTRRVPLDELPSLGRAIRASEKALGSRGRVFVRYSGTEPLMRILVEGPERAAIERISRGLADTFKKETEPHGQR